MVLMILISFCKFNISFFPSKVDFLNNYVHNNRSKISNNVLLIWWFTDSLMVEYSVKVIIKIYLRSNLSRLFI